MYLINNNKSLPQLLLLINLFFFRLCCQCIGIITGMNEYTLEQFTNKTLTKSVADKCLIDYLKLKNHPPPIELIEGLQSNNYTKFISISGIELPVVGETNQKIKLVEVESTKNNLRKIALGITTNKALCLQGPVGSGKTALIEYLAEKTGRILGENFIKIQLGDQTDSKMLLGTYRCTDIPGEFVWQPGVLTQVRIFIGNWN